MHAHAAAAAVLSAAALAVLTGCSSGSAGQQTPAAPTSTAVSPSDKFLALAHGDKLPANDDTMIPAARDFCSSLPFPTPNDLAVYTDQLVLIGGMNTNEQAQDFEYDAASAFCPEKLNDLSGN